jgi:hypothetical protein
MWALQRLSQTKAYRTLLIAAVASAALLGGLPSLDDTLRISRPWRIHVPVLGPSVMTDGRGVLQILVAFAAGLPPDGPTEPVAFETGRAWVEFSDSAAAALLREGGTSAFGFRHMLYNVNTVRLQELIRGQTATELVQVDPIETGNMVQGDMAWLTSGAAARACLLLTSDDEKAEFSPVVDRANLEAAAVAVGFRHDVAWTAPNGHTITVWRRDLPDGSCRKGLAQAAR